MDMGMAGTIGVVVPGLYNMFFSLVMDGIEAKASEKGYSLLLNCTQHDHKREMACLTAFLSRNVSGVIVISPNMKGSNGSFYQDFVSLVPMVFIDAYPQLPGASHVYNDQAAGAHKALSYLYALGHRHIMFVRGASSDSYEVKEQVFHEFMKKKGLSDAGSVIDIGDGNSVDTVDNTTRKLVKKLQDLRSTAIFCCNDMIGVGAIHACRHAGLRVPEDVSVVGYDNISLARYIEPKLTSVDQNMYKLGTNAVDLLLKMLEGGPCTHVVLENEIVERASTGPGPEAGIY